MSGSGRFSGHDAPGSGGEEAGGGAAPAGAAAARHGDNSAGRGADRDQYDQHGGFGGESGESGGSGAEGASTTLEALASSVEAGPAPGGDESGSSPRPEEPSLSSASRSSGAAGGSRALRERLAAAERANVDLRARLNAATRAAQLEISRREERIEEYCKQVDALSGSLEQVVERCGRLEGEVRERNEQLGAARDRVAVLERNADTLRQLAMEHMSAPPSRGQRRSAAEQRFWDELATPELLAATEPPAEFPVLRQHPSYKDELTATRAGLRKAESEVQRLQRRLLEVSERASVLERDYAADRKEHQTGSARQQQQLMGAVRRIHYMRVAREEVRVNAGVRVLVGCGGFGQGW